MRETENNIQQYKAMLPRMKEKLTAMTLMLIIAVTVMTSTTFAWITISTAPEVFGISTTITGNGSLEIALSNKDGVAPGASAVGDSLNSIVEKNMTWGNLVNLSDESYGLDDLILRPATLNTSDLDGSPLFAAYYGGDGRVNRLIKTSNIYKQHCNINYFTT
ncbi:MAG: hypothetical protein R3Y09_11725 [Clostridia bacterium]